MPQRGKLISLLTLARSLQVVVVYSWSGPAAQVSDQALPRRPDLAQFSSDIMTVYLW